MPEDNDCYDILDMINLLSEIHMDGRANVGGHDCYYSLERKWENYSRVISNTIDSLKEIARVRAPLIKNVVDLPDVNQQTVQNGQEGVNSNQDRIDAINRDD